METATVRATEAAGHRASLSGPAHPRRPLHSPLQPPILQDVALLLLKTPGSWNFLEQPSREPETRSSRSERRHLPKGTRPLLADRVDGCLWIPRADRKRREAGL